MDNLCSGIAKLFKFKFGGVAKLLQQRKKIGEVAVLKEQSRFIYYLVTKEVYNHKPTYADVRKSLVDLRRHAIKNGVTKISMPAIGCGLDKLNFETMKLIVEEVFLPTNIAITFYLK